MDYSMAWLSYRKNPLFPDREYFRKIYVQENEAVIHTAAKELSRAAEAMFDESPQIITILKEAPENSSAGIYLYTDKNGPGNGGYHLYEEGGRLTITAEEPSGILYGCFALIRKVQRQQPLKNLDYKEVPDNPLRMLNHWDNMDGSIERGYSGDSFFFKNQELLINERTADYARLVSSIGINGVVINNVNVKENATKLISEDYAEDLKQLAMIFRNYGISLYLSLNFAAPMELGGLDTADPEAAEVRDWWEKQMKQVYASVPDLGGFLVKADSEVFFVKHFSLKKASKFPFSAGEFLCFQRGCWRVLRHLFNVTVKAWISPCSADRESINVSCRSDKASVRSDTESIASSYPSVNCSKHSGFIWCFLLPFDRLHLPG